LVKPYIDFFSPDKEGERLRTFEQEIDEMDLIWHRDREDRQVAVEQGENWKLQMDNELPKVLEKGKLYNIPRMTYHRIIKGDGDLVLKIWDI
jgi:hypothetical protein